MSRTTPPAIVARMLEEARRWLADLRAGADRSRFDYTEAADPDDPETHRDAAADDRARLLLALQYDFRPDRDAALVRFLLAAEIDRLAHEPMQGIDDDFRLAAHLVSLLADPADVWQLWRAKHSNFDTACGLDSEHLVAAGVGATLALVRASDHPLRDAVLAALCDPETGECVYTEDEVVAWRAGKAEWFPAREEDESLETRIERAIRFAPEQAGALLDTWLSGQPRSDATLRDLCHWARALGDFDRAEAAARELVARASDADAIAAHERLASVLVQAGRLPAAEVAMDAAATLAASRVRSS